MVYTHRTKSGKLRHYRNKAAYDRSLKGLFSNHTKPSHLKKNPQKIDYNKKQLKQTKKPTYSGKINLSASLKERAKHKPHENKFLMENNWQNSKKEFLYVKVDGDLKKFEGKAKYSVDGLYIADALTAKDIQSIHNHPSPHPPSDRDIFDLLYSGNRTRETVIASDGKMYILLRTPQTKILTKLDKNKLRKTKKDGFSSEELSVMNRDEEEARKKFTQTYHDIAMKVAKKQKIEPYAEVALQKAMLEAMSKHYKFNYVKMILSPNGNKMQHNFLITRMLFSKSDAKKIANHIKYGYKGAMIPRK
ncbi:MAG: hypothetical protein ACW990_00325 [Promethearchaeota archaeon]|jgi:hypothetical protein